MKPFQNVIMGISGVTGVEIANQVQIPASTEVKDLVSVVIQIVIGLVTLLQLLKKKDKNN